MADTMRAEKSGFAAEAQSKVHSKYDEQLASKVLQWIASVSGEMLSTNGDVQTFCGQLKDGQVLCKCVPCPECDIEKGECRFANTLSPGAIPKVNSSKLAFKQMENISFFLNFLEEKGDVPKAELFHTPDLFEEQDPNSVIVALTSLARKSQRLFNVEGFGPKEADKGSKREWTQEQLRAGEGIIGLQAGSTKGASQKGMTPAGMTRHM